MTKQKYTITEMTEELKEPRINVRRRIESLDIKALNENNRSYKTEPLNYDRRALNLLAESFEVELSISNSLSNSINNDQGSTTKDHARLSSESSDNKLIKQLEEALEHEKERFSDLSKKLDKSQNLQDQQQQLSLNDKRKIEELESKLDKLQLEYKVVSDPINNYEIDIEVKEKIKEESKPKWYHIFNKNK